PTVPAATDLYALSLHDALPISPLHGLATGRCTHGCCATPATIAPTTSKPTTTSRHPKIRGTSRRRPRIGEIDPPVSPSSRSSTRDRKSTRLNSSHVKISYAVFC